MAGEFVYIDVCIDVECGWWNKIVETSKKIIGYFIVIIKYICSVDKLIY